MNRPSAEYMLAQDTASRGFAKECAKFNVKKHYLNTAILFSLSSFSLMGSASEDTTCMAKALSTCIYENTLQANYGRNWQGRLNGKIWWKKLEGVNPSQ